MDYQDVEITFPEVVFATGHIHTVCVNLVKPHTDIHTHTDTHTYIHTHTHTHIGAKKF